MLLKRCKKSMPAPKTKKYKVIPNPELIRVCQGFVPAFGNTDDLNIVNCVFDLEKKLSTVDNEIMRKGDVKKLTPIMKRLLYEEKYLIASITRRNMDF